VDLERISVSVPNNKPVPPSHDFAGHRIHAAAPDVHFLSEDHYERNSNTSHEVKSELN
jgi:hypothetical protein